MLLVTERPSTHWSAVLPSLLIAVACRAPADEPAGRLSDVGTARSNQSAVYASSSAPVALASSPAPSASSPSAPPSVVGSSPVLDAYPAVSSTLGTPCDDPRVVLAIRKEYDRSGRIWVQQALLAHPEFTVVDGRAERPFEIDVYETIYGVKRFSRAYVGQPRFSEAVVARCGDARTCERLAAMFHAVLPTEPTELVCGVPPATTGGFAPVRELAPDALRAPLVKPSPQVACARVHACAARGPNAPAQALDCSHAAAASLADCAKKMGCPEVVVCAAGLTG